jgi:diacylglycerol kinase (ATP)
LYVFQLKEKVVMKRARLIYNSSAGNTSGTLASLLEGIKAAGYETHYDVTVSEEDLDGVLNKPTDVVVVAGGDGSLRAVVKRLLEYPAHARPALTVLPLGTANNVANMLMPKMTVPQILGGLSNPVSRAFDIGSVRCEAEGCEPGENIFLEGAGVGLFANMMANYQPDEGKNPFRALQVMTQTLSTFAPQTLTLRADEQQFSESFVMLEVMNTNAVGPRLPLAPQADAGDGLFDVVLVREDARVGFLNYVTNVISGSVESLLNVEMKRLRRLELTCWNWSVHADAEIIPVQGESRVSFEMMPGALELWLPELQLGDVPTHPLPVLAKVLKLGAN